VQVPRRVDAEVPASGTRSGGRRAAEEDSSGHGGGASCGDFQIKDHAGSRSSACRSGSAVWDS